MVGKRIRRGGYTVAAIMGLFAAADPRARSGRQRGPDRLFSSQSNPTTAYKSATCVFLVGQIADGQTFSSLSQCGVTATFNHAVEKRSVRAGGSWATWGSPPFTEGNRPGLIANFSSQLTITLSSAKRIVGMELEGNLFQDSLFTVKFRDVGGQQRRHRHPAGRRQRRCTVSSRAGRRRRPPRSSGSSSPRPTRPASRSPSCGSPPPDIGHPAGGRAGARAPALPASLPGTDPVTCALRCRHDQACRGAK